MKILDIIIENDNIKLTYLGRFNYEIIKKIVKEHFDTDNFNILEDIIIYDGKIPVNITIKSNRHENKKWIRK